MQMRECYVVGVDERAEIETQRTIPEVVFGYSDRMSAGGDR